MNFNLTRSAAGTLAVFLVCLCSTTADAQTAASASATEQLREFVKNTRSASGEFQQSQLRRNGRSEISTGQFGFSRPGKFRWEIKTPYQQLMVGDGQKSWFFDKDLNQVTVRKQIAITGATPAAILFGSNELDKDFTLTDTGSRQGLDWLDAVPKTKESGFDKISIGFAGGVPVTLEIRDGFNQLTTIVLKNFQRNPTLPAHWFQFTPPKGADVVEQ